MKIQTDRLDDPKNYSLKTIKSYLCAVKQFWNFCEKRREEATFSKDVSQNLLELIKKESMVGLYKRSDFEPILARAVKYRSSADVEILERSFLEIYMENEAILMWLGLAKSGYDYAHAFKTITGIQIGK